MQIQKKKSNNVRKTLEIGVGYSRKRKEGKEGRRKGGEWSETKLFLVQASGQHDSATPSTGGKECWLVSDFTDRHHV